MKKKIVTALCMTMLAGSLAGCGSNSQTTEETAEEAEQPVEEAGQEAESEEVTEAETEQEGLTFEDLSEYEFIFCSGAGGWSEEFTIEADGSMSGAYHDSDMGDMGDGYENGTVYVSSYTGHFTDLKKIDEYSYEMQLSDISYEDTVGEEEIQDQIRYVNSESACFGYGNTTYKVCLPGMPLDRLSDDVVMWLYMGMTDKTELDMVAIVDEENEIGIFSYERQTPYEEAKNLYDTYKSAYDGDEESFQAAETTVDMSEYAGNMYEDSDACLNAIWNVIKENLDEESFNSLLEEQREWIAEKEAKGKEIEAEEQGTLGPVDYQVTLAELTMARCEELLGYLE